MYLRRDEQRLQGYGGIPPLVEKGVQAYEFLRKVFSPTDGFTVHTEIGQYIKEPPRPGSMVLKCTLGFRIATYLPDPILKWRRDSSFNFKLEYEYDGINLLGVRIIPQEKGSSSLRFDKFGISFEHLARPLPGPVAVIRYYITGTWDQWRPFPLSHLRHGFDGELDIHATGRATLKIQSDDNRVRADPMPITCPILPVPITPVSL